MPSKIDVREELKMVARITSIDAQLDMLQMEKGDLPDLVNRLQTEYDQKNTELDRNRERISEIGKEKRELEGQMQLARIKKDKYKEQLYSVTTNREYDALTQEIDAVKSEIAAYEASMLALMEEEESLNTRCTELTTENEDITKELDERGDELTEKEKETEQEEQELHEERKKLGAVIKKPILAHYERIKRVKGVGAANLYASACGTCFAVVPPQRQAEIRRMEDIILCESCGVILLPESDYIDEITA